MLALAASLLDFSYYVDGNILHPSQPWSAKAWLLLLVFADHLTLVSLLVLGSWLRPAKIWRLVGLLYLLYCAIDRTTLGCFDVHAGAGLQFARMLKENPESLQWVGGWTTLFYIGKKFLEFLAILTTAVAVAYWSPLDLRVGTWLGANLAAWLLAAFAPASLWLLCLNHLRTPAFFPRLPTGSSKPLLASVQRFRDSWRQCASTPSRPAALSLNKKPHIVLVVGESWNASVVDELSEPLQPYLKTAVRSRLHYSGANTSTFGLFSLLAGRESCFFWGDLDQGFPIYLPITLKLSGYHTSFWGCAGYWPLDGEDRFLKQAGFDSVEMGPSAEFEGLPERDRELFSRLGPLLRESTEPQFITLFTGSTHYPYHSPKEWELERPTQSLSPLDRPTSRRRYRNSMRFSLDCLARLLSQIDFSQTIVIVVGDHGESMGEDNSFGHATKPSQAQFRTNFWLWAPGLSGRQLSLSSHVDIAPTLVHLLTGAKQRIAGLHGCDLLEDPPRNWNFCTTFGRPDQPEFCALHRGEQALVLSLSPALGVEPRLKGCIDERARDRAIALEDHWPECLDALSRFWQQSNQP